MDWKALDHLIQDHELILTDEAVEKTSKELLLTLNQEKTTPIQAMKVAYVLALLQLKKSSVEKAKVLQFITYFETIFRHEVETIENSSSDRCTAHLLYLRKLSEHYLHHLMVLAEFSDAKNVIKKLHSLRKKNHQALLLLQQTGERMWDRERRHIRRYFRKHYLFFGLLFSLSLYFCWSSFWGLSDMAMTRWAYTEFTDDTINFLVRDSLLMILSGGFIWAFVRYQKPVAFEEEHEEEQA